MSSICGAIRLVVSGATGEISAKTKDTLDIALRNGERLTHIVNDILDFEKLERGKMIFRLKPQEIIKLVNDSIEANKHYGEQYQIQYLLNKDSVSAVVNVDADRFIQIMNNLLSNAAKFSLPNSTVDIKVSKLAGNIRIAVKDNGIGIDDKLRPLIFQKFTQAENADKHHPAGTGLGLAICKGFIEQMGGKIGFKANQDVGTTFYFDLPESRE